MLAALLSAAVIVSDIYARRVPNAWLLTILILGTSVIFYAWMNSKGGPPWPALLGMLIGLSSLIPFHIFGWMGAGDVKFFSVLGLLLGTKALLPIWIIGSLIAGIHVVLILLSRSRPVQESPSWMIMQSWLTNSAFGQRIVTARRGRQGLPYAAWLGVGALTVIINPALMHW